MGNADASRYSGQVPASVLAKSNGSGRERRRGLKSAVRGGGVEKVSDAHGGSENCCMRAVKQIVDKTITGCTGPQPMRSFNDSNRT